MELQPYPCRIYTNITAAGEARQHNGDIYNYYTAESTERRVIDWLTTLNPSQSHSQACKRFQVGTFGWFFEDIRFLQWRDAPEGGTPLWCQGSMGTGKTTLVAQIVQHLQAIGVSRGDLAVVYSRYTDRKRQTVEDILGSILAQLFQQDDGEFDIPADITKLALAQPGFWQVRPTLDELEAWLDRRLELGGPVNVIVDAADEMDPLCRSRLFSAMRYTHPNMKLLVTSRKLPDIGLELHGREEITIQAARQDLWLLASTRLNSESNERFRDLIRGPADASSTHETVKEEILHMVIERSRDMFLLVSFYVDRILECTHVEEMRRYLRNVPQEVDAFYDEAWQRATGDDSSHKARMAKEIIMWIYLAEQDLTAEALGEVLSAAGYGNGVDALTEHEIISSCAGLVRSEPLVRPTPYRDEEGEEEEAFANEPSEKIMLLAHPSVWRYLTRKSRFPLGDDLMVDKLMSIRTPAELLYALPIVHTAILSSTPVGALCLWSCPRIAEQMILHGTEQILGWELLAVSILSFVVLAFITFVGLRFNADSEFFINKTVRSLDEYVNRFLEDHVSGARLACRLRVYMRSTASHKTLLIIFTVWGPYVALAVLMLEDRQFIRARYFWVACQACYLVVLFVMLAGARKSKSTARWSDIHVATVCSCSGAPVGCILAYPLEIRTESSFDSWEFLIITGIFLAAGAISLRLGSAFYFRNPLDWGWGERCFSRLPEFIALCRDFRHRLRRRWC
ncbi:hypothetical protein Q7P37_001770 [Cladosporium fusiforme]